jgi:hypothetical protein
LLQVWLLLIGKKILNVSKSYLNHVIKEELAKLINEQYCPPNTSGQYKDGKLTCVPYKKDKDKDKDTEESTDTGAKRKNKKPYEKPYEPGIEPSRKDSYVTENKKDDSLFTFFDDPVPETMNDPWLINPKTGEPWPDWDPLDDQQKHEPDPYDLHPEDRVEYYQDLYEQAAEELGANHSTVRFMQDDVHKAMKRARAYANKYNLQDSDYYEPPEQRLDLSIPEPISVDPSIVPSGTESLGRFHGSDRTPFTGRLQRTTSLNPTSVVDAPQAPNEYLSPFELPVTESLKK